MKYRIYDNIDGWEVCQFIWPNSNFHGKWFAARDSGTTWCKLRGNFYTEYDYIHADGTVRKSLNNGESWSGYFTTKEGLVAAIHFYNARNVVMRTKVIIDGIEYAPVSESNPNAKQIATALIERYMGKFNESEWKSLANELQVYVSEDMNQPTVMQTVAEILAVTNNHS